MHKKPAILTVLIAATGLALTGCSTTAPAPGGNGYSGAVSPQMREHERKQRLRYEEGNYRRLYRPKGCRHAARDCDGFPSFRPS